MSHSVQSPTGENDDLWKQFEFFKAARQQESEFMEELLLRYDNLNVKYNNKDEAEIQKDEYILSLENFAANSTKLLNHDPWIMVLIDGDGMIFNGTFLQQGETGGRIAAYQLQQSILSLYQKLPPNLQLPLNPKICCRLYANLKGLADILHRSGVVDDPSVVDEFFRGFTQFKQFEFIDVGSGKDRADTKIADVFDLFISDVRCRHIFLGCSHDNGYARLLENLTHEKNCASRVFMLGGVPFEKELEALPFRRHLLTELFRAEKINVNRPVTYGASPAPAYMTPAAHNIIPYPMAQIENLRSGSATRSNSFSTAASGGSDWPAHYAESPELAVVGATKPIASGWANIVKKPAPPTPAATPGAPRKLGFNGNNPKPLLPSELLRNRAGQRIDLPVKPFDKAEVDRIKKIKMCNVHFLRGDCPYGDACTHNHEVQPSRHDLETLVTVARMAPCTYGADCKEVKCIYGHACQAPSERSARKREEADGRTCIFGSSCRFPPEMHGVDMNIVRGITVGRA
ncbi:hypothetical protein K402DRAFT_414940 [Aulographum hederae CBS 113979]|uniref:C3H1-type domain-containing protein n=1 Tax=Aulographum hederae CBS 113979 TaxID=1176131 RepID=A0A6G1GND3_9PEZI|nr:hypothetical protein K402DRAFT_414940 [Aulographum hederae CBS 113979]